MSHPKHQPIEYVTLCGEDYNLRRAMEAKARETYCAPENRKQRKRDIKYLAGDHPTLRSIPEADDEGHREIPVIKP